ncbi:A16A1 dehydrogenase, partial [Origma solitaria]|nr:A16A1 dehydrogenase [Origma solitaria]
GNTALVLSPPAMALPLLLLGELSGEGATLPPGVLNVLTGPPGLCQALRAHPEIISVTFLGASQEELQSLVWGSPCRGPRVRGPQGGRVVVIVLDSADLDSAAAAIATTAATPLALDSVVAALEKRLRARLGGLQLGDPLDPKTEVGSLPPGAPPPEGVVQEAREEGAQVFQALMPPLSDVGDRFYPPTLISGVALTSRCLREPAPGPLLVLLPVRGPTEAVAMASALPRTAAAAVWAQDITVALDTANRLPQGLVWLNALDLLDPSGGCAGGAADTDLDEVGGPKGALWGVLDGSRGAVGRFGGALEGCGGFLGWVLRGLGGKGVGFRGSQVGAGPVPLQMGCAPSAPPPGAARALVAAGLPGGALVVLPGNSRRSGSHLARQHPDGLWLCGENADCAWASAVSVPRVWGVPAGLLGAPGRDPPPGAERELELRCTRPHCLWLPGGGP